MTQIPTDAMRAAADEAVLALGHNPVSDDALDAIWLAMASARDPDELREALDEIGYHAEQIASYIAQPTISEKHLASARFHNDKIRTALSRNVGDAP